jgi:tRNA(Arg) A34 adenosine deaminase TadA
MTEFLTFMDQALDQARLAGDRGEVPVGAVVVQNGVVISRAGNETRATNDPTAHAEILALRAACQALGQERLLECDLYVTLEPCPMCAGAIANARVGRLYFGASDPKSGGVLQGACVFSHAQSHHKPEVYEGLAETECQALLTDFFQKRRDA